MTNFNADLGLSIALEKLKRKYPECFQAGNKKPLDEYVEPNDEDWLVIVAFRKRVRESEAILKQCERREVIRYAIDRGLNFQQIAKELKIPKSTVRNDVRTDKEFSDYYDQAQEDYKKIVIYNSLENTFKVYGDVRTAANKEKVSQKDINASIVERHNPQMLTGFKQAKRLLFYKIDQGIG